MTKFRVNFGEVRELTVGDGGEIILVGDDVEMKTRGPESFKARSLVVVNTPADVDVDIQPYKGSGIVVTIEGPAEVVDAVAIFVTKRSGVLTIDGSEIVGRSTGITIRSHGSEESYNTVVMLGNSDDRTKISINVPKRTPIGVSGVSGKTTIGEVEGPLTARIGSSGKLKATNVKETAKLTASANAKIAVGKIVGLLTANASTSGKIHVEEQSDGNVVLETDASGKINIGQVAARSTKAIATASGRITIKGGHIGKLTATALTSGRITFDGTTTDLTATASTSGRVTVSESENRPVTRTSTSGRVKVGNW